MSPEQIQQAITVENLKAKIGYALLTVSTIFAILLYTQETLACSAPFVATGVLSYYFSTRAEKNIELLRAANSAGS